MRTPVVVVCKFLVPRPGILVVHFTIHGTPHTKDSTRDMKRDAFRAGNSIALFDVSRAHNFSVEVRRNLFPHDYNIAPGGYHSQEEIFHHEFFTIQERENGCEFSVQTLDKTGSDMLKF